MTNLTHASRQLFTRPPDEWFASLADLSRHCVQKREQSRETVEQMSAMRPTLNEGQLALRYNGFPLLRLTDWSFTQLCGLAGAAKDTVNRLQPRTAGQVLIELLEGRDRSGLKLQTLIEGKRVVRAITGEKYTRLWNADLVAMLQEFATDFTPPPKGFNGATGLYAGEQDLFCFMIDPTGWAEIDGEAFAPGFFVWNSEVGRRSVGVSTFWFQAVCANHIVWDATDIVEFTRRHIGNVADALKEIRQQIEALVTKRDERRDCFATVIKKAMTTNYGTDAEDVLKRLATEGFPKALAQRVIKLAWQKGKFTVWTVIDALTKISREERNAGGRVAADQKAVALLDRVAA